jgi:hypothetical protein
MVSFLTTTQSFAQTNNAPSYQVETPPPIYLPLIFKNYNPGSIEGDYVLLGWNDLGMHCYNSDFQDIAVLPPYNNLWAQVVKRGDPPMVVTDNIEITYSFPDNTYSVGKSNFWEYAQDLFGLASPLPDNIGLTGKGLSGTLDVHEDHFAAEGIPLTEFSDSAPNTPYPYQKAEIKAFDETSGEQLAGLTVVAPVSTEMHCDNCHSDGQIENIATGKVETNILTLHDMENQDEYPIGHRAALITQRPVLCATCHASNALAMPGINGIPNLSNAIHEKHSGKVPDSLEGCYNCHPGPTTECLRDVMSTEHDMDCVDCHGGMEEVSKNPQPWLNEPTCSDSGCHTDITQDQPLYRLSKGHGEIYCAACHDSPHAIAPSNEANDGLKFIQLQGFNDTLQTCTVCHLTQPTEPFWHNYRH